MNELLPIRPRILPGLFKTSEFAFGPAGPNTPPSPERWAAENAARRIITINDQAVRSYYATTDPNTQQDILREERERIERLIETNLPISPNPNIRRLAAQALATQVYAINNDAQARLSTAPAIDYQAINDDRRERIATLLEPNITVVPPRPFVVAARRRPIEYIRQSLANRQARRRLAEGFVAGLLVAALAVGAYELYENAQTAANPTQIAAGDCKSLPAGSIAVGNEYTVNGETIYSSPNVATIIEAERPIRFCVGNIPGSYQEVGSTDQDRLDAIANNYRRDLQQSGCAGGQGCNYVDIVVIK